MAIILNNLRIFLSASENFWKRKKISHSHLHTQSFVNVCHLYRNTNIVAKSPSPKLVENVFELSSTIFVQVAFSSVVHSQLSLRSCHMKTWKYLSLKISKRRRKITIEPLRCCCIVHNCWRARLSLVIARRKKRDIISWKIFRSEIDKWKRHSSYVYNTFYLGDYRGMVGKRLMYRGKRESLELKRRWKRIGIKLFGWPFNSRDRKSKNSSWTDCGWNAKSKSKKKCKIVQMKIKIYLLKWENITR